MLEGCIVQQDDPRELFERPRSAAVARFFGAANVLRGTVRAGLVHLDGGGCIEVAEGRDGPATYVPRPEAVCLEDEGPLRAEVVEATYAGTFVRVALRRANAAPGGPCAPRHRRRPRDRGRAARGRRSAVAAA
jgi:ABC-type Fe3+/spermidine/putrescine transport system ATPase subunit